MRAELLDRRLAATADVDFRALIFHEDTGALVAVTAHERFFDAVGPAGEPVPGSYLMLVAITDRFRGGRAPDGRRLIDAVLDVTFEDIRSRARGAWVFMRVRPGNEDGLALAQRLAATRVTSSEPDELYVVRLA